MSELPVPLRPVDGRIPALLRPVLTPVTSTSIQSP